MAVFSRIKNKVLGIPDDDFIDDYVEIDSKKSNIGDKSKIIIKPYTMQDFADIKDALDDLREGFTIALINIKYLKDKDIVELKRAVTKLKKTCDAIEGDIAGLGDDWIVVTPSFAQIFRNTNTEEVEREPERQKF
ncbi:cell division protein SepF [Candidatus Woesearchaeota archaeon]|nr:cell division protein SepF [Candidatus Woesearchaeota archaeon]